MIDFLKLSIFCIQLIEYLNSHDLLVWVRSEERLNLFDNETITTKNIKKYKGIYFCFYSNKVEILFRPHYYFNANLHNANDFKIVDCISVINDFKNTFQIDLNLLKVINIEFGLNVVSPIDIKDLIRFLVYHEKNEFITDNGLAFSKRSFSPKSDGTANKYKTIKAYAKGIQFPDYCDIDTLRIEIKSKEHKYIKEQIGIETANNLLDFNVYHQMSKILNKESQKFLILDCVTDFKSLNLKDQNKINEYLNSLNWYKFLNQNRNSFCKNRATYFKLINKVENNLKNRLGKIINDKLEFLKEGAISTTQKEEKKGAISNVYNNGICTLDKNISVEVEKVLLSFEEQKNAIAEHNLLAVQKYNARYKR